MNFVINISPEHSKVPTSRKQIERRQRMLVEIVTKSDSIPLRKNDYAIILDTDKAVHNEKKDSFVLRYKAKVTGAESPVIASDGDLNNRELGLKKEVKRRDKEIDFYKHQLELSINDDFSQNRFLDDYTFSLLLVNNYKRPHRHFGRKFRALDSFDYETLIKEQLFVSRTAMGRLYHAIPYDNQLEFIQMAIVEFGTTDFASISTIDGLAFLREYVNQISYLGKFLKSSYELLEENFASILDPKSIGFIDVESESNNETADLISDQVKIFDELFELEDEVNDSIDLILESSDIELASKRFEEKFKRKSWPIRNQ